MTMATVITEACVTGRTSYLFITHHLTTKGRPAEISTSQKRSCPRPRRISMHYEGKDIYFPHQETAKPCWLPTNNGHVNTQRLLLPQAPFIELPPTPNSRVVQGQAPLDDPGITNGEQKERPPSRGLSASLSARKASFFFPRNLEVPRRRGPLFSPRPAAFSLSPGQGEREAAGGGGRGWLRSPGPGALQASRSASRDEG